MQNQHQDMSAVPHRRTPAPPRKRPSVVPRRRRRPVSQRREILWLPYAIRAGLSLGVLALIAVIVTLLLNGGFDDPNPQSKTIQLTGQDVDPEITNQAKTLLRQNQLNQPLALYLWGQAQRKLPLEALPVIRNALGRGQVTAPVAPLAKELSDDLDQGRAAAYVIWVEPDDHAVSGTVRLQLDGVVLGDFPISRDRYAITLFAKTGSVLHLQISATPDSPVPVVFRAETAAGDAVTRKLPAGKSDSWELFVQQSY